MNQRGFSLLEAVIVAAIVATIAAIFFGASPASHPFAARSAGMQFDAALAYARATASANGSATLAFAPRSSGGVTITVAGAAPFEIDAGVRDKTLGPPPFVIELNGAGHASGAGCPAGGWVLTFRSGPHQETEPLPCHE